MRKLRDDDRGITLVELIVSIAILAIIVLPFLNSFVTAARTNAKSRNELNATHLAENIMEGIEKNSMKSLAYQFNYPSEGFDIADGFDMSANGSNSQELLAGSGGAYDKAKKLEDVTSNSTPTQEESSQITSSIHKKDKAATIKDTNKWDFVENDSTHKYYFYMTNVKSGTKNYNALVTMDARSDEAKESGKTDGKKTEYNKDAVADMSAMDFDHDAIWTDNKSFVELKNDLVNENLADNSLEEKSVSRTITVDITNSGSTKVAVSCSYEFNGRTFPVKNTARETEYTSIIFDNSASSVDDDLRNIYLFYSPWYSSTSTTAPKDKIIINNNDNVKCTVNIIKQMPENKDGLASKEDQYKISVKVIEQKNIHSTADAYTTIASNFNTNLGNTSENMGDKQVVFNYNNSDAESDVKKLKAGNLTRDVASDRIYDVKVDIFESKVTLNELGATKPVVSITGSMVD